MKTWRRIDLWIGKKMSAWKWINVWGCVVLLGMGLLIAGAYGKSPGLWIPGLVLSVLGVLGMYANSLRL